MTLLDFKYLADIAEARGWDLILTGKGVRMSTSPYGDGHHFQWTWADLDGASRRVFDRGVAWLDHKVAA